MLVHRLRYALCIVAGSSLLWYAYAVAGIDSWWAGALIVAGTFTALLVVKSRTFARKLAPKLLARSAAARRDGFHGRGLGSLRVSPDLEAVVIRGKRALISDDWGGVTRAITSLLGTRFARPGPDDIPAALLHSAAFLAARDLVNDRAVAELLSDEAAWWFDRRDEPMIQLQILRSDLQEAKYRKTADRTAQYLATVMLGDAVDRMTPSKETGQHAGRLVQSLLWHFSSTGETESLDRAEAICRDHPAVAALHLDQVLAARERHRKHREQNR